MKALLHTSRLSGTLLVYLQMLILYSFSAGLALAVPVERGTVSLIIMPLLSALIIDPFDRLAAFNLSFTVIYCILIVLFKAERLVSLEMFSILVSCILSLVAHAQLQSAAIRRMLVDLRNRQLIAQLRAVECELQRRSETDGLSGLLNRETLIRQTEAALETERPGISALCILDVDHFKEVNDTYGHLQGDRLLAELAAVTKAECCPSDVVGRLGGDEFMIFLSGFPDREQLCRRLEQLHQKLTAYPIGNLPGIPTSMGVAILPACAVDFETLYQQADEALYEAKRNGRNQIRVVSLPCPQTAASSDRSLAGEETGPEKPGRTGTEDRPSPARSAHLEKQENTD